MEMFWKLQDTAEVHGFEWGPTFVGMSFEQSRIQYIHNPASNESVTCTGVVESADQLPM